MSWKLSERARKQHVGNRTTKAVLNALAHHGDDRTGLAFPSQQALAESAELCRRAVRSHLVRLQRAGLIEDTGQRAGKTGQLIVWRLNLGQGSLAFETPRKGEAQRVSVKGGNHGSPFNGEAVVPSLPGFEGEPQDSHGNAVHMGTADTQRGNARVPRIEGIEPKTAKAVSSVTAVFDAWNAMASANNLPTAKKLTPARRKSLNARLKEFGLPAILKAVADVPRSRFLTGGGPRGWKADFDFICGSRLTNLIEGRYANPPDGRPGDDTPLYRLVNEGRA